jgi:hypothetical protein
VAEGKNRDSLNMWLFEGENVMFKILSFVPNLIFQRMENNSSVERVACILRVSKGLKGTRNIFNHLINMDTSQVGYPMIR